MADSFDKINDDIASCKICESLVDELKKTNIKDRGGESQVMIVGRNPGNIEKKENKPFAGPSGKRLEEWLVSCGANKDNPREGLYFTSALKCFCDNKKSTFCAMASNCQSFLKRQVKLVKPSLVITLGEDSYNSLRETKEVYSDAIFNLYKTEELVLMNKLDFHFHHLVWPHPSPMNRNLNDQDYVKRLKESFEIAKSYFRKE